MVPKEPNMKSSSFQLRIPTSLILTAAIILCIPLSGCGRSGHSTTLNAPLASPGVANNAGNQQQSQPTNVISSSTPITSASSSSSVASQVMVSAKHLKTKLDDITYAQLSGLPNAEVQSKLNAKLAVDPNKLQLMGKDDSYTLKFRLLYQAGNLLELDYESYDYAQGAAHGMPGRQIFLMDLDSGQTYQMSDLFLTKSNYLDVLSKLVKKKDTQHVLDPGFTGVEATDGFQLTQGGVDIFFTPYQWSPYAVGFPTFFISFDELKGVINTSGSLWKAIQSSATERDLAIQQANIQKIQSLGFQPSEAVPTDTEMMSPFAAASTGKGQTLYAICGLKGTSGKGDIFFFLDNKYLGTDTLKVHDTSLSMYPDGASSVMVTYDNYQERGTDNQPFTIRFTWDGTKLQTSGTFPQGFAK